MSPAPTPSSARDVVIALGPWSGDLLAALGTRVMLGIKRGYHRHYGTVGDAVPNHPLVDDRDGFVLTPNRRGLRVTSGVEFARRDAPPASVQIDRAEVHARALFPLGERLEADAWLGCRPCLPDLLPMIGPVPGLPGCYANFGHQHLGLTLGPVSGRLLAEIVTGAEPCMDPSPYRVDRPM